MWRLIEFLSGETQKKLEAEVSRLSNALEEAEKDKVTLKILADYRAGGRENLIERTEHLLDRMHLLEVEVKKSQAREGRLRSDEREHANDIAFLQRKINGMERIVEAKSREIAGLEGKLSDANERAKGHSDASDSVYSANKELTSLSTRLTNDLASSENQVKILKKRVRDLEIFVPAKEQATPRPKRSYTRRAKKGPGLEQIMTITEDLNECTDFTSIH